VQVVIALIVTPEGFPLAYEVLAGNTADKTTLREFLKQIETQYGQAERIRVMDRGIPTEEVLTEMRASDPPVRYLVGTPKGMELKRDALLLKLGAAQQRAPSAWRLIKVDVPQDGAPFQFSLRKDKLRSVRKREGRYLLRTNLAESDPARLWEFYMQLTQVEEAFKKLKGDLALRPIFHQKEGRIEAHIFVAFLAYCLHVTLGRQLRDLAPGLTPRSVLEKFAAVQMIDVHLPTSDGREVVLTRYTQPEPELEMLLRRLKLELPPQPPPKIRATAIPTS
jgi:transposase